MSKTSSIFKNVAILGVKLKKKWKSYWCKRLNVLENIWSAKQKEKGFIWSVEEKKNEGGKGGKYNREENIVAGGQTGGREWKARKRSWQTLNNI